MAIASMTGFARKEGSLDGFSWTWELKSVNGRNLELRTRLPGGYDALESFARNAAAEILKRGNVNAALTVNLQEKTGTFRVNETALAQVEVLVTDLRQRLGLAAPGVDGILALRGILEVDDPAPSPEVTEQRMRALQQSLAEALKQLHAMRHVEGKRLLALVDGHLNEIERLCKAAGEIAAGQPSNVVDELHRQRPVESELMPKRRHLRRRGRLPGHERDRVARNHAGDDEGDGEQPEQRRHEPRQPMQQQRKEPHRQTTLSRFRAPASPAQSRSGGRQEGVRR